MGLYEAIQYRYDTENAKQGGYDDNRLLRFYQYSGLGFVNELDVHNITEGVTIFAATLCLNLYGLAPVYLSDIIVMSAGIMEYNMRAVQNRDVFQPRPRIEKYKKIFLWKRDEIWNATAQIHSWGAVI